MEPTRNQLLAALETLGAAGFSLTGPAVDRLSLLSVRKVSQLLEVGPDKARAIMRELPGSVMLPGGDLRARASDLDRYLDQHPATPKL